MTFEIRTGDALELLRAMPAESVHCCVTSPPYWGLRDYGVEGQIGLESSLAEFLDRIVAVFAEVRRVLRKDGTCWVNLGDAYAGATKGARAQGPAITGRRSAAAKARQRPGLSDGFKHKDMMGIPWRVAFALQDCGWYLRSDIIWHKPNPMPESVYDRPTRSHEYLFLLTKSARYAYDADAIREPTTSVDRRAGRNSRAMVDRVPRARKSIRNHEGAHQGTTRGLCNQSCSHPLGKNKRTVWKIAPQNFRDAHFATYPEKLVEPCILAGCPVGGVVLDPFTGSGTTGVVAVKAGRSFIGLELNPRYADMARMRISEAKSLGVPQRIEGVA